MPRRTPPNNPPTLRELTIAEGRTLAQRYPCARHAQLCADRAWTHDGNRYTCTRPTGHDGPHVGHVDHDEAIATWERG